MDALDKIMSAMNPMTLVKNMVSFTIINIFKH